MPKAKKWKGKRRLVKEKRAAGRQLQTVNKALQILSEIQILGRPDRKRIEVYLWKNGVHKSLAELTNQTYALYGNLTRQSLAQPLAFAVSEVEERGLMSDLRQLLKVMAEFQKQGRGRRT